MSIGFRAALASALLSIGAINPASAQVTIGTPNTTTQANNYPFGSAVGFTNFQQRYSSSLFTGPINIGAISLYNSRGTGNFQVGTFNLFLSTTTATAFSTSDPAGNRTNTPQLFATVTYGLNTPVPSIITFLGTPFLYDPSAGNLLLDVTFTPNGFNTNPAFLDVIPTSERARSLVSTAATTSAVFGSRGQANFGFVTTFDAPATTVPEPSTYALMTTGLVGVLAARRRIKRA